MYKRLDTKGVLQDKAEAELDDLKTLIVELQAKAEKAKSKTDTRYNELIDELRQKQEKAEDRLQVFKSASGGSWRAFAADLDNAITDLRNSVTKSVNSFN